MTFLNSYHFIPRNPANDTADFDPNHHHYLGHSGTIRCRLTLEQSTVIGGRHESLNGQYTRLYPYLYQGRPAIPATSIKGLIASLAEAASLSAYRVLKNETLTVLLQMNRRAKDASDYLAHRRTDLGSVHDYVDQQLRPLSAGSARKISLAEQLFGFVIPDQKGEGCAFAGRVRPSIGLLDEQWLKSSDSELFDNRGDYRADGAQWVRLKEMSQPMKGWPNSSATHRGATPAFYFRDRSNPAAGYAGKADFTRGKSGKYEIQGQKAYLHHLTSGAADAQPWKTAVPAQTGKDAERKSVVRPLKAGVSFEFTLAFDNLSDEMLRLLCFALRPAERYRHKIGYGKPLGLGSVRIDPVELCLIDRRARYADADFLAKPDHEKADWRSWAEQHRKWLADKHPAALKAFDLIGESHDFDAVGKRQFSDAAPVLWVPLAQGNLDALRSDPAAAESDTFRWFADNERDLGQRLTPISQGMVTLPELEPKKVGGRGSGAKHRQDGAIPQAARQPRPAALPTIETGLSGKIALRAAEQGQIQASDGRTFLFVSRENAQFNQLAKGDHVEFDLAGTPQDGIRAINVKLDED